MLYWLLDWLDSNAIIKHEHKKKSQNKTLQGHYTVCANSYIVCIQDQITAHNICDYKFEKIYLPFGVTILNLN